jgi:hypothetical protein
MTLITAPNYIPIDKPLIFLAGPIQGAADWQSEATRIIHSIDPEQYIASPRRLIPARRYFSETMFNEQVDWETYHLRKAGENGAVMFWLAREYDHMCERAYAQTSRAELFEWKMRHERDRAKMAVGIDEGFTGSRYIIRRFTQDCPEVPILRTLEETCGEAMRMIRR